MRIETRCTVCDSADGDGGHLFFKCCLAKEVWRNLNLESFRLELATTVLVKDAVELILKAKEEQKLMMIITMWYIWQERNIIREEGRRRGADFLARCIRSDA